MTDTTDLQAINDAKHMIAQASADALKTIADAAAEAKKVVSNNACKDGNDHDLIVELRVRMEDLKNAIVALSSGVTERIDKHEVRLNELEKSTAKNTTLLVVGGIIMTSLAGIIIWFMQK